MNKFLTCLVLLLTVGCLPDPSDPSLGCITTMEYAPVCGEDGITYGNPSSAGCANVAWTPGPCTDGKDCRQEPEDPICGQPPMYHCGGNGEFACMDVLPDPRTYFNFCELYQMEARYIDEGSCPCEESEEPVCGQPPMPICSPVNEDVACAQVMPPLKTYDNICLLRDLGAEFISKGPCPDNNEL